MVVEGISTNIPLHRVMMEDPIFIEGGFSIHYLEQKLEAEKDICCVKETRNNPFRLRWLFAA